MNTVSLLTSLILPTSTSSASHTPTRVIGSYRKSGTSSRLTHISPLSPSPHLSPTKPISCRLRHNPSLFSTSCLPRLLLPNHLLPHYSTPHSPKTQHTNTHHPALSLAITRTRHGLNQKHNAVGMRLWLSSNNKQAKPFSLLFFVSSWHLLLISCRFLMTSWVCYGG